MTLILPTTSTTMTQTKTWISRAGILILHFYNSTRGARQSLSDIELVVMFWPGPAQKLRLGPGFVGPGLIQPSSQHLMRNYHRNTE